MAVSRAWAQATPFASAQLADRIRLTGTRSAVTLTIQAAIIARPVLRLRYRDRHDVMTSHDVEPVATAGTRAHWYLVDWRRLRQATRTFPLDRIHAAADNDEPAPHHSHGDLDVNIADAPVRRVALAG